MIEQKEPFKRLLVQGMIMGESYRIKKTGKYVPKSEVTVIGNTNSYDLYFKILFRNFYYIF